MKKKRSPQQSSWQHHLDQLDHDLSADAYFIREFKLQPDKSAFTFTHDFFSAPLLEENKEENDEGSLSLDIFQKNNTLVIKATLAGVDPQNLDIALDNDILTIRGHREIDEAVENDDYFYQECYWGKFSRTIVLPVKVASGEVNAAMKNGLLTITLPIIVNESSVKIDVTEIE